ncbi:hypothetical protein [Streptosporangium lutulentum]|uniref:Uncharacterized protein n=1 Tax=Streptosporangium lutulentum TaxID=1461250 RepID=A0ABT9QTU6_9ACTN|nr:hypothetical protein [Streptosporangium lutulentum]MDP9850181.1 hypothetical protein [Streptosporangium lutulentum]
MVSLRPIAGAILTSVLLAGYASSPASATTQESSAVSWAEAAARPANGKILYDRISGGQGILRVKNGTTKDAVVTLVRGKTKAISVFVRAKSKATVDDVRDGTYRIYFTSGYRFSTSKGRFARSASYQRFDRQLTFTTSATRTSGWELTLNTVKGGNARTSGVNPKDFPS